MAHSLLVLLILVLGLGAQSRAEAISVDRTLTQGYLGEKNLDGYSERYGPVLSQDIYRGKIFFADDLFTQNFFRPYLFQQEGEYDFFLRSELNGSMVCSNEQLSKHFDDIRYSYRLLTLSYLLEGQWHMRLASDHLGMKNGCQFDFRTWLKTCRPQSSEMKKFIHRLGKYFRTYDEKLPPSYGRSSWMKDFSSGAYSWYSHYRIGAAGGTFLPERIEERFRLTCENDQYLMSQICSEEDEIYGLSQNTQAYQLLGLSNIINTYNKHSEALGCLRRFSELMAHKEVRFDVLNVIFPVLQKFLRERYQERYLQGRVFFFGSGKEFEEKGVDNFYVTEQPLQVKPLHQEPPIVAKPSEVKTRERRPISSIPEVKDPEVTERAPTPPKEIMKPMKSAFLLAAEVRRSDKLDRVDVDMLKFKYDYVFGLNMINILSDRLKTFMTRDALKEMLVYDKLGTKEGPVPLLFLKFMIDMQEHHGLWNIVSVLGDKFYVSNEIDEKFSPMPEYIQLVNNEATDRQWQIYVLRP